jgi:SNF2 family DNA or RNA helicase
VNISADLQTPATRMTAGERIRAAEGWTPRLPATLQAELRDYQIEGVVWMSRLARWGAGACLADDMGLGKTVQAIAVLLDQAEEGPCLVVAPTSVCPNWHAEIARFAPTLRTHALAGDRAALVNGLGSRDVLICADSDRTGHLFRFEGGHVFRSDADRRSDLMSAT